MQRPSTITASSTQVRFLKGRLATTDSPLTVATAARPATTNIFFYICWFVSTRHVL